MNWMEEQAELVLRSQSLGSCISRIWLGACLMGVLYVLFTRSWDRACPDCYSNSPSSSESFTSAGSSGGLSIPCGPLPLECCWRCWSP